MNEYIKNLKTPIAIVGLGRSGDSAKKLLKQCGFSENDLVTFDGKALADYQTPEDLMSKAKPLTLVVSPGVPLASMWIQQAKSKGVHITSEISLACSFLTTEKLIGVTGSLGKSTTVSLLGAAVDSFSSSAFVGGNLGIPFCEYALGLLQKSRPVADWVILELSSYQLENSDPLKLDYSAITYLSPNHLERYRDLEDYYETKWSIQKRTRHFCYLNKAGGDLIDSANRKDFIASLKVVSPEDADFKKFRLEDAALLGRHNLENIALATAVALGAGWPESSIDALKKFSGLAHRLENLGLLDGIRFINDSKATALDSVLIAVKAAQESTRGTLFVLLGGKDKNLPWQDLSVLGNYQQIQFYFFGECREIAKIKSGLPGNTYEKLEGALVACLNLAKKTDTVLLSPGGTSLDEFKSFEDRGDFFKRFIQKKLKKELSKA